MALLRTLRTQQPSLMAFVNRSSPLAHKLLFVSTGPMQHGKPHIPATVGNVWAPNTAAFAAPPIFPTNYNPEGFTTLSIGILNGTANSGNQQGGIRVAPSITSNTFSFGARLIDFAANGQASFSVSYGDFTAQVIGPITHNVSTAGGRLALGLAWKRNTTDGMRAFINGKVAGTLTSSNLALFPSSMGLDVHIASGGTNNQGYLTAFNAVWERQLSDSEMQLLSDNPWQLFTPELQLWAYEAAAAGNVFNQSLSSSITLSSTVAKQTQTRKTGSITTSAGPVVSGNFNQATTGFITLTGALSDAVTYVRAYASSITLVGGLVKPVNKVLRGTITVAGAIVRRITKATFAASLTLSSTLSSFYFVPGAGGLGNLARRGLRFMRKHIGRR